MLIFLLDKRQGFNLKAFLDPDYRAFLVNLPNSINILMKIQNYSPALGSTVTCSVFSPHFLCIPWLALVICFLWHSCPSRLQLRDEDEGVRARETAEPEEEEDRSAGGVVVHLHLSISTICPLVYGVFPSVNTNLLSTIKSTFILLKGLWFMCDSYNETYRPFPDVRKVPLNRISL